jgi:hypothetical protein
MFKAGIGALAIPFLPKLAQEADAHLNDTWTLEEFLPERWTGSYGEQMSVWQLQQPEKKSRLLFTVYTSREAWVDTGEVYQLYSKDIILRPDIWAMNRVNAERIISASWTKAVREYRSQTLDAMPADEYYELVNGKFELLSRYSELTRYQRKGLTKPFEYSKLFIES